jgi:hypothetical protein
MNPESKILLETVTRNPRISDSSKNLRSKIDSIVRSIENLSQKKLRIEFEMRKQQQSLTRKRQELKKRSRSNRIKVRAALESSNTDLEQDSAKKEIEELLRLDSILLQESDRVLDL